MAKWQKGGCMSSEQEWVDKGKPVIQFPVTKEEMLVNRFTWNARMMDLLQERKEALLNELRGVDAQIQTVTSDLRSLTLDYVNERRRDESRE
jgi:hypothetical protein